jgi:predicted flap endonuclease-1-like 5' DNA nuclease
MTEFEFQIIALILVAFIIGVVIGYFLRTRAFPQGAEAGEREGITLESRQERPSHALLRGGAATKAKGRAKPAAPKAQKPAEKPAPKPEEKAKPAAKTNASPDNLQQIKGIGAVLEKKLNAMGIERFEQIANWTEGDIAEVDEQLNFRGRIQREKWVEQAHDLTKQSKDG